METLLIIVGAVLLIVGLIGCIVPVLPGPVLGYLGLVVLQFLPEPAFKTDFLVTWGIVVGLVTLLDYYVPIWGTKRFGGSRAGVNGSIIGAIIGFLFFPPLGIIIGPFFGAYIGELIGGQSSQHAWRSALGSFMGFLAGTFMKIIVVLIMIYNFIDGLIG